MPDPYSELLTLRDLLRWAISRFNATGLTFGHGSNNAQDEAAYLLLHTLHLPLDTLEPFLDARVLAEERLRFIDLVEQRIATRKPAAYLTGEAWLQGHRFRVDERVIIPRSPISELLAECLSPWVSDPHDITRVMDLCTGSGCLAILAALTFQDAKVHAVDISADALEVAKKNIVEYALQDRVYPMHSDLFDSIIQGEPYDLILCNPPYVNTQSMAELPEEYRHEPPLALAGGVDGMDLVRRILDQAATFLAPGGLLMLEIGHEYPHFNAAFPQLEPVWLDTVASSNQILLLTREQLIP